MSEKTSYKARTQKAIILQEFKKNLARNNHFQALCIYAASEDIPEEDFQVAWYEIRPNTTWPWAKVRR